MSHDGNGSLPRGLEFVDLMAAHALQGLIAHYGFLDIRCVNCDPAVERLCDVEQAKVDAIRAPLKAAAERDVWPRHLYWGEI